eukprot:gnl/Spiro4/7568_TR3969_c0_g1_i1.p1 gnl/Spiro4/7568_TR3969_c0_g1~~gnl/Spiro4/7568_TR3969_c0_g1_i1.p1  ORF type:complete len:146 (-),score=49.89 gnl/Spiro4/7568_TR3969_c0_g1_i1:89-496(-)
MFNQVLKEHQQAVAVHHEKTERLQRETVQAVSEMSAELVDCVNSGVARVFANQQKIECESTKLQQQTARFAKQTSQWLEMYNKFQQALKELGDFDNWARTIESDMKAVALEIDSVLEKERPVPRKASQPNLPLVP